MIVVMLTCQRAVAVPREEGAGGKSRNSSPQTPEVWGVPSRRRQEQSARHQSAAGDGGSKGVSPLNKRMKHMTNAGRYQQHVKPSYGKQPDLGLEGHT